MNTRRVDYDQLAAKFDHRYPPGQESDSGLALLKLVAAANAGRIVEVGSGTGHWLELLYAADRFLVGVDYSRGMLTQAQEKGVPVNLVQGAAQQVPVKSGEFDLEPIRKYRRGASGVRLVCQKSTPPEIRPYEGYHYQTKKCRLLSSAR